MLFVDALLRQPPTFSECKAVIASRSGESFTRSVYCSLRTSDISSRPRLLSCPHSSLRAVRVAYYDYDFRGCAQLDLAVLHRQLRERVCGPGSDTKKGSLLILKILVDVS